ncbi:MAG: carbonic anhydrase family protein [Allosphingosinicella sp.]
MDDLRGRAAVAILAAGLALSAAAPAVPQSPIAIDAAHSCVAALPRLVATRRSAVTETWRNTGSPDHEATIRVAADPPAGTLDIGGKSYELRQYHLHAPAEHKVAGRFAAMEIHYVYEAADGSLAVIARLVDKGPADADFGPLLAAMPTTRDLSVTTHSADPLGHVLRPWLDQPSSYRYVGSLTTPPFTGQVAWIVLADHITFSAEQMDRFERIFPHGNRLDVQPIGDRIVRTDVAGFAPPCR